MGRKKYMSDNVEHTLIDNEKTTVIPKDEIGAIIENLAPKTQYHFNISAFFSDGLLGTPNQIKLETKVEGYKKWKLQKFDNNDKFDLCI